MSLQQDYQERARAIRERLVHPPNAVLDPGIDLKRPKSGMVFAEKKKPVVYEYPPTPKPVTVTQIAMVVSKYFSIGLMDLMGRDRRRRPSIARHVAMYLAIVHIKESTTLLGAKFYKDRTICSYAKTKITDLLQTDPGMREVIRAIEERLFQ